MTCQGQPQLLHLSSPGCLPELWPWIWPVEFVALPFVIRKAYASDGMVLHGQVRGEDKLGNGAADEAADFGRRRVSPAVIDARRNLFGVCGRWYPVILDLHRFFVAISRTVVNHDGHSGTAPDPLVWSAGALHKRRRLVHAVRDRALFAWASWYLVL